MNNVDRSLGRFRTAKRFQTKTQLITSLVAILLIASMTVNVYADSSVNFVQTWTTSSAYGWNVSGMELAHGVVAITQYQYNSTYSNDTLYALATQTGKLLWNITVLDGGDTALIGSNRGLLFAAQFHPSLQSARLLAIEPLSGGIVWSVDEPKYSANFLAGDAILTYGLNQGEAAYDASTGALKWLLPNARAPSSSAYGDGVVFVVEYAPELSENLLLGLDASSGVQKWMSPLAWTPDCLSFANGMLFAEDFGNRSLSVVGLSASEGKTVWNKTYPYFNQYSEGCPAFEDGQLFFLNYPPYSVMNATAQVVAVSTSTGSEQWRHMLPCHDYQYFNNANIGCYVNVYLDRDAVGDGLLFVSVGSEYTETEYNATVYALGTDSGSIVWTHDFQNTSNVRMLYGNGTLYTFASPWGRITGFSRLGASVPEYPNAVNLILFAAVTFTILLVRRKDREPSEKVKQV